MKPNKEIKYQLPDYGKIPPQAVELEEAVLGAIMLEKDAIYEAAQILRAESFYKNEHQEIYRSMYKLFSEGKQIDMLTVTEELRKQKKLEEIGGPYYIAQLTNKVASAAHVEVHSRIIEQKYIQRELIRVSGEIQNAAYDEAKDLDDIMTFANSRFDSVFAILDKNDTVKPWKELVELSVKEAEKREILAKEGKCTGRPTPLVELTEWTQGWQPSNVIVIAARPSMGKTAFALSILKKDAQAGGFPAMFSLETTDVSLASRILLGESGVDADRFRTGKMQAEDWQQIEKAASKLYSLNIHIDDKSNVSIEYIKLKCRALKKKGRLTMILIDYLQLANGDESSSMKGNREREVAEMSRKCKIMAKELNVPVILLSQLNRAVESRSDKRPILADLRESGAIEQDADMVIFLNRPEKYGIEEMEDGRSSKGIGEAIIAKNKEGRLGIIDFRYNESLTSIYDYETSFQSQQSEDMSNSIAPNLEFERSMDTPF